MSRRSVTASEALSKVTTRWLAASLLALLSMSTPAAANPANGSSTTSNSTAGNASPGNSVLAPPAVSNAIDSPRLSGSGRFTWFGLKVYEARLWVGSQGLEAASFATAAFALELQYARSFEGKAIAESSASEIEQLGIGNEVQRQRWRDAMIRLFPNVTENDRLVGIHKPGQSVRFTLNDRAIGAIEDPDFGAAFFAIWLDPKTRAPGLRQAMLAGAGRRTSP
jgi:hypothetical protein